VSAADFDRLGYHTGMRILVLTPTFLPALGGAELVILQVFRRLAERHSVMVLTPYLPDHLLNQSGTTEFDRLINFDVVRYHDRYTLMKIRGHKISLGSIPPFSISAVSAINSVTRSFQPDIINVHYVMPTGLAGLAAKLIHKIPVIVTYNGRDVPGPGTPLFWKYWHRLVGNSCSDMTFVSKYCREVIYGMQAEKGHVIYNGVDDPVPVIPDQIVGLKARWKIENENSRIVFCLTRLSRLKRVDILIKSMPIILARQPNVRLIIGGQGDDRPRLQELAAATGVLEHVIFAGFIPSEEMPIYFNAADLFAFHSTYETFGMVLAEAMNYGKAIVTVDNTAIKEIITNGKTGILVPEMNPQALAQAVLNLLENQTLRSRLEENSREKARNHFRWDSIAACYEKVFKSNTLKAFA
jgi:phosphatidylinositol alpha-1,6-mannosyltransferase